MCDIDLSTSLTERHCPNKVNRIQEFKVDSTEYSALKEEKIPIYIRY